MSVAFVGDVLGDALVRPGHVVVRLVSGQDCAQVCLAEDQYVVEECPPGVRRSRWPASSTTPDDGDRYRCVRVTHRFHPMFGQDLEFVVHRRNWGEDRVYLRDENGVLFSLPAGWTDVEPIDPFVVAADCACRESRPRL